jgi:hypothetical protein
MRTSSAAVGKKECGRSGLEVASLAFSLLCCLFHPNLGFPTEREIRGVGSNSDRSECFSLRPQKISFSLANLGSPCLLWHFSWYDCMVCRMLGIPGRCPFVVSYRLFRNVPPWTLWKALLLTTKLLEQRLETYHNKIAPCAPVHAATLRIHN